MNSESIINQTPSRSASYHPAPLPLPGVIIFVHGVNSDGEWYEAAERGLCDGLNVRLARQKEQMAHPGVEGGQLHPVSYTPELTAGGFLNPKRSDTNFIDARQANYSNIIRFRWGYKASKDELKEYGDGVWLNENDYWGGGPFANGCSSIADLWADGLNDRLFLWLTAQHFNPVSSRDVYTCPPRAYYVHAAMRLARLIKSIRDKQTDCPITVICHSQGNMVGIAAAFLADTIGVQADNYILNNPPLSLVQTNGMEAWTQRFSSDKWGNGGREDLYARQTTVKNFFGLLRARAQSQQDASAIDGLMANENSFGISKGFKAADDRSAHGINGSTHGRVTLYCCPHDQVISAANVQGIGWMGLSQAEIDATEGHGVFSQRVFAQGFEVGRDPGYAYRYWDDRWNKSGHAFWSPQSPSAIYSIKQGLESDQNVVTKLGTIVASPLMWLLVKAADACGLGRVNADPPKGWTVPITAPKLPQPFKPQSLRYGKSSEDFDEGYDPAANARDRNKAADAKGADDPYDSHATRKTEDGRQDDAPLGNADTEAQMRYEDRARLRMKARREGKSDQDKHVAGEDADGQATAEYQQWRTAKIKEFLALSVDQNATDHSTIVTNPMHATMAMAYDVAVGFCHLTAKDWANLRIEADWRYSYKGLKKDHPNRYLGEYFVTGMMGDRLPLKNWVKEGEAVMPSKVIDQRSWSAHNEPYPQVPSIAGAAHAKGVM